MFLKLDRQKQFPDECPQPINQISVFSLLGTFATIKTAMLSCSISLAQLLHRERDIWMGNPWSLSTPNISLFRLVLGS
jgi:hypothetical protein